MYFCKHPSAGFVLLGMFHPGGMSLPSAVFIVDNWWRTAYADRIDDACHGAMQVVT